MFNIGNNFKNAKDGPLCKLGCEGNETVEHIFKCPKVKNNPREMVNIDDIHGETPETAADALLVVLQDHEVAVKELELSKAKT